MPQEPRKPRAVKAEVVDADARAYAVRITYENGLVARPIPVQRDSAGRYEAGDAISKQSVYRNAFGLHLYLSIEEEEKARLRALIDAAIEAWDARAVLGAPAEAPPTDETKKPGPAKAEVVGEEKRHYLVRITYVHGFVAPPIRVAKRPLRRYDEGDEISERAVYRNVFGMHHYLRASEEETAALRALVDSAIAEHEARAARRAAAAEPPPA